MLPFQTGPTFFVTSVTRGRRALLQSGRMAQLLIDVLQDNRRKGRFLLHEFVIMPDHFHLLLTPLPEVPLEKALQFIKGGFSYRAKKELHLNFDVWQAGFTSHLIRDAQDYEQHRLYVRDNPVNAGLAVEAQFFPYSSAFPGVELDTRPQGLHGSPGL